MSRRKLLMKKRIAEVKRVGKDITLVMPKKLKRKSLLNLFNQKGA